MKKKVPDKRQRKKVTTKVTPKTGKTIKEKMGAVLKVILITLLLLFIIGLLIMVYFLAGFSANDLHQ